MFFAAGTSKPKDCRQEAFQRSWDCSGKILWTWSRPPSGITWERDSPARSSSSAFSIRRVLRVLRIVPGSFFCTKIADGKQCFILFYSVRSACHFSVRCVSRNVAGNLFCTKIADGNLFFLYRLVWPCGFQSGMSRAMLREISSEKISRWQLFLFLEPVSFRCGFQSGMPRETLR